MLWDCICYSTHDPTNIGAKLELAERINKILFYKNKQCERRITELQKQANSPSSNPGPPPDIVENPDLISENEKLLLAQVEQQKQRISELQDQLNTKLHTSSDTNEHAVYMQKRVEELSADSRRFFEKYRLARHEYMKVLSFLTNEKLYGVKKSRETMAKFNAVKAEYAKEDQEQREAYEKRRNEVAFS